MIKQLKRIKFVKNNKIFMPIIIFILLCVTYLINDPYVTHIVIIGCIYGFLAIGLNIITGLAGQINLGMAGFYAIGSYTSAILSSKVGMNFWLCFIVAIIFAGIAGLIIGYPCLKVRGGVYLVLVTVSFASLIQTVLTQWISLTNGPMGIIGIASPSVFGLEIVTLKQWLVLIFILLYIVMVLANRLENSRVGRSLKAIRESDISAMSLGINVKFYKILAFSLSAAFAGAGGSLYAHYMTTISPDIYTMNLSVSALTMIVIGGVGAINGSIIGGLVLAILPEVLRGLGAYQMVVYSLIIVLATIFLKKGILGFGMDSYKFFRKRLSIRGEKNDG